MHPTTSDAQLTNRRGRNAEPVKDNTYVWLTNADQYEQEELAEQLTYYTRAMDTFGDATEEFDDGAYTDAERKAKVIPPPPHSPTIPIPFGMGICSRVFIHVARMHGHSCALIHACVTGRGQTFRPERYTRS